MFTRATRSSLEILPSGMDLELQQFISLAGTRLPRLIFVLICLFARPHRGSARIASAAISGTVADQSGTRIRDARNILRRVDTGVEHTTSTGAAGPFSLTSGSPGEFAIRAMMRGFDTTEETTVAARQPFPYITPTEYDDSTGRSNYNALRVQLNRRTSGGLTYLLSYT